MGALCPSNDDSGHKIAPTVLQDCLGKPICNTRLAGCPAGHGDIALPSAKAMIDDLLNSGIASNDSRASDRIFMRRIRTLNAYILTLIVSEVLGLAVMIPLGLLLYSTIVAVCLLAFAFGLWILRRGAAYSLIAHLQLVYSLVAVIGMTALTGGALSNCLPLFAAIPLWAGLVLGMRCALVYGVLAMAAICVFCGLGAAGVSFPGAAESACCFSNSRVSRRCCS